MTVKEFRECIEYNIQHNLKHAVLGLGAPGVGKSQLIQQIGKKYGYKVIDIRLAQMSEVEIGGLIYPNESRTKTVWPWRYTIFELWTAAGHIQEANSCKEVCIMIL
jgi:hypothetical protein